MSTPNIDRFFHPTVATPQHLRLTRWDLAAIGLLAASLIAIFWKVIFTPAMFFYRDICNYTYPSTQLMRELCRQGTLPYWNPYLNFGQPMLANPNLLFFYPSTLLILLLPFDFAYTMHFVVHFALGGVGTYLLARMWQQSCQAALFAAFIFVFSGPVLSLGNVYNTVACCAWIPWALLATDRALENQSVRSWILVTIVFALQWLSAEPFSMMATFGLCFAHALYRRGSWNKLWSRENLRVLAIFFCVGAAMVLLCAVQLLPGSDLLSHSTRGQGLSFHETTIWSVNPFSLLEFLTPNFAGSVLAGPPAWIWLMSDRNDAYNISNFIGVAPFFFALTGWTMGANPRRSFVATAAAILLLLSLGHYTPVFALARLLLPVLGVVRFPIKLVVHITFLVAILAGWGFDAMRSATPSWRPSGGRLLLPLQIVLGCTILASGIAWLVPGLITSPLRWEFLRIQNAPYDFAGVPDYVVTMLRLQLPGLAGFGLGGLLLIKGLELGKMWARSGLYVLAVLGMSQSVMVNYEANPTVPKSFYTYRPRVLDEFKDPPGTCRFLARRPDSEAHNGTSLQTFVNFQSIPAAAGLTGAAEGAFQSRLQLYTGSMYYRIDGSVNLDQERAIPPFLRDLEVYLERIRSNPLRWSCLLGRTNVKYILCPTPIDSAATRVIGDVFNGSEVPGRLYEALYFLRRAYVAGNSLFTLNNQETFDRLSSPDFDTLNTVILAAPAGSTPSVSGNTPTGQVQIEDRGPNCVSLRAHLLRPGYVLLLDRFDPNWRATLDGLPTPVLRANQIFRAVYAASGDHQIRFEYHQHGLFPGLILSLLTVVTLVALSFCKFTL